MRTLDNGQYTLLGIVKGREHSDNQAIFTAWSSIESRLEYGSRGRSVDAVSYTHLEKCDFIIYKN